MKLEESSNYEIVFQKLSELNSEDNELFVTTDVVAEVFVQTSPEVEELRLLAECKSLLPQNQFYSGT